MIVAKRFGSETSSQSARAMYSYRQCSSPTLSAWASPWFSSSGTTVTVGAGMSGCSTANHTAIVEGSESRYRWMSSGTGPSRTITSCAGGSVCSIVPDCTARSSSRSVLPEPMVLLERDHRDGGRGHVRVFDGEPHGHRGGQRIKVPLDGVGHRAVAHDHELRRRQRLLDCARLHGALALAKRVATVHRHEQGERRQFACGLLVRLLHGSIVNHTQCRSDVHARAFPRLERTPPAHSPRNRKDERARRQGARVVQ